MRDIPAGETWCGAPARPIRTFMKEVAWLSRSAAFKPEKPASGKPPPENPTPETP